MKAPLPLLLLLLLFVPSFAMKLNIHIPLSKVNQSYTVDNKCPYNAALEANLGLRDDSHTEELDFFSTHTPHITLFLSDFEVLANDTQELIEAVQDAVANFTMCAIDWNAESYFVAGPYAMYTVAGENTCLRQLSDSIVLALQSKIIRPPEIPSWVWKQPLWSMLRKLWNIRHYGSPNVFSEYQAHVTVGFDTGASPSDREAILKNLPVVSPCRGTLTHVVIAKVEMDGSVLQSGSVLASIPLVDGDANVTSTS